MRRYKPMSAENRELLSLLGIWLILMVVMMGIVIWIGLANQHNEAPAVESTQQCPISDGATQTVWGTWVSTPRGN